MDVISNMTPSRKTIVTSGTARIAYRCFGDSSNPAILMLHGNGEDYTCFSRQLTAFADSYYIIAPDSRGHGESSDADPFTLEQMAADTLAVLDDAGVSRAHILGFSDGGNVALLLALQSPATPRSLILVGANLFPEGLERKTLSQMRREHAMARMFSTVSQKQKKAERLLGLMTQQPQIDPESLKTLDIPSLIVAGENDLIRRDHTQLIASSLPQAHMRIVPSCGHFPLQDQAEWTNALIAAFLRREGGR